MIKFLKNGIKDSLGNYFPCHYSNSGDEIRIYGKRYKDFSQEIRDSFTVKNESDVVTDYFENDKIVVSNTHPRYSEIREIADVREAVKRLRYETRVHAYEKRMGLSNIKMEVLTA
jgi:hypothetical protein